MSLPVLLDTANSRGALTTFRRVGEFWYSSFPPRACQNSSKQEENKAGVHKKLMSHCTLCIGFSCCTLFKD